MSTAAYFTTRALFRDREGAILNTLVLLWIAAGWLGSFALMASHSVPVNIVGILLCAHSMVLAAYLIHEAAHQTVFAVPWANRWVGEAMNFIVGSSYASFERIQHMHLRHHRERTDLACFDFKALMRRHPAMRRTLEALEWAYVPGTEIMMHLQVICRPFLVRSQRAHLPRVVAMLILRGGLLVLLGMWSLKALVLYGVARVLLLHVLNFFDAFHHSFEQHFVQADIALPLNGRDRAYEDSNTYSNLISRRYPWLNLLTLNFGYHNAHHQRCFVPWYRLPAVHRELYGERALSVSSMIELLSTWHRHRVVRVTSDDYGTPGEGGPGRVDHFIGAHGVSFLTVV
jgi:fatty acid desaturase